MIQFDDLPKVKIKPNIIKKDIQTQILDPILKTKPIVIKKESTTVTPIIDNTKEVVRQDTLVRKFISRLFQHVTRKSRLATVVASKTVIPLINEVVYTLKDTSIGARHLLNLHIHRCIQVNLPTPDLDEQNLYSHACRSVSLLDGKFKPPNDVPPELLTSAEIYRLAHPVGFKFPDRRSISNVINTLQATIQTEVANHLNLNITGRFSKYLKNKYGIRDRYQREHIVRRVLYSILNVSVSLIIIYRILF